MKKILFILALTGIVPLFFMATGRISFDEKVLRLVEETTKDVRENILPFWEKNAPDVRGGFYGTLLNDGTPLRDAPKGGVLNARILWTFSKAYELFKKEKYKQLADRAQDYFVQYFIDPEYGGTYWTLRADGTPENTDKQTYGIAFGIYGLAQHYRSTGNSESLRQAIALYHTLEKHAYDSVNGGYIELFTRNWQTPPRYGYDGKGIAPKTMNTHLHVLEAYTLLYRVWPDSVLEKQLRNLIEIFLDKIIDRHRWHQRLFLTMTWENLDEIDSYGHDIELSWLIYEAAMALKDASLIERIRSVTLRLVTTQMKEGWTQEGYLLYERAEGEIRGGIEWWPQAESVVAFFNAWEITADPAYLDAAVKTWEWIKTHLIDYEYGEWFGGLLPDGTPNKDRPKADLWKCPYHNSRMGFELFDRTHR